jgi:hypothetical protein
MINSLLYGSEGKEGEFRKQSKNGSARYIFLESAFQFDGVILSAAKDLASMTEQRRTFAALRMTLLTRNQLGNCVVAAASGRPIRTRQLLRQSGRTFLPAFQTAAIFSI